MLETQRICKLYVNSLTFPSIYHSILLIVQSLSFWCAPDGVALRILGPDRFCRVREGRIIREKVFLGCPGLVSHLDLGFHSYRMGANQPEAHCARHPRATPASRSTPLVPLAPVGPRDDHGCPAETRAARNPSAGFPSRGGNHHPGGLSHRGRGTQGRGRRGVCGCAVSGQPSPGGPG